MRELTPLLFSVVLCSPLFQDGPERPTVVDGTAFAFVFDQGWNMSTGPDRASVRVTEAELTRGLGLPSIAADTAFRPTVPTTGTQGERTRRGTVGSATNNVIASVPRVRRHEPIKANGSLTLASDGSWTLRFDRIEYTDPDQKWVIEFGDTKMQTLNLVNEKWKGARADWPKRLEEVEQVFTAHYLKLVTPQEKDRTGKLGLVPQAGDDGRSLFVQAAVEEQMIALLLARIDGRSVSALEQHAAGYPPRVRALTAQLIARLTAQCRGEIAPTAARAAKSRKVEKAAWDFTPVGLPTFSWDNGSYQGETRVKAVADARGRLTAIVEASRKTPILEDDWFAAIDRELAALNTEAPAIAPKAEKPTVKDALVPELVSGPKGTFDFEEKLKEKDGELLSSRVIATAAAKGQVVRFFDATTNRWRTLDVDYDTYWKATVTRK